MFFVVEITKSSVCLCWKSITTYNFSILHWVSLWSQNCAWSWCCAIHAGNQNKHTNGV